MKYAFLPPLSPTQEEKLIELERMAIQMNQRINLYSDSSVERFRERHLLHSLALAVRPFPLNAEVADWGTGGGMPGLPLAIAFPDTTFHLVDSVAKKIRAVEAMTRRLGLPNVQTHHARAEDWQGYITHSVSRATAPLKTLWEWHIRHHRPETLPGASPGEGWPRGLICLKGGDLDDEIRDLTVLHPDVKVETHPLPLTSPHFRDKCIVMVIGAHQGDA